MYVFIYFYNNTHVQAAACDRYERAGFVRLSYKLLRLQSKYFQMLQSWLIRVSSVNITLPTRGIITSKLWRYLRGFVVTGSGRWKRRFLVLSPCWLSNNVKNKHYEVRRLGSFAKVISGSRLGSKKVNNVIMSWSAVRANHACCHIYVRDNIMRVLSAFLTYFFVCLTYTCQMSS